MKVRFRFETVEGTVVHRAQEIDVPEAILPNVGDLVSMRNWTEGPNTADYRNYRVLYRHYLAFASHISTVNVVCIVLSASSVYTQN